MIIFKDYMTTGLLPDYILQNDSYKVGGKGFVQRFLEIFGLELDEFYYNKIEELEEEWGVLTCNSLYLDYYATMLGDIPKFLTNNLDFARFLSFLITIYQVKGSERSYLWLLTTLGFDNVTITEYPNPEITYDADPILQYDSEPEVQYDLNCSTCSEYDVNITSAVPLTGDLFEKIKDLISLIEPLGAKLKNIVWNGDIIEAVFIEVQIIDGNLIYENENDSGLVLTLVNGDLIIDGPNADQYYIDGNGDLYFIN